MQRKRTLFFKGGENNSKLELIEVRDETANKYMLSSLGMLTRNEIAGYCAINNSYSDP